MEYIFSEIYLLLIYVCKKLFYHFFAYFTFNESVAVILNSFKPFKATVA